MNRRTLGPIPVSGAWTPQDPIAFRKFAQLGPLRLENGSFLPEVTLAYETLGTLNEDRSNAILVLHALTGDAHISGPTAPGQSTAGWGEEAVGPGKPLDQLNWIQTGMVATTTTKRKGLTLACLLPVRSRTRPIAVLTSWMRVLAVHLKMVKTCTAGDVWPSRPPWTTTGRSLFVVSMPGPTYPCISSPHGHDGFLIEYEQLNRMLSEFLENQSSFVDSAAL